MNFVKDIQQFQERNRMERNFSGKVYENSENGCPTDWKTIKLKLPKIREENATWGDISGNKFANIWVYLARLSLVSKMGNVCSRCVTLVAWPWLFKTWVVLLDGQIATQWLTQFLWLIHLYWYLNYTEIGQPSQSSGVFALNWCPL